MELANVSSQRDVKCGVNAALLTATLSEAANGGDGPALLTLSGAPFIEFQINQLARAGIQHILLEIDTVPGALLHVADRARSKGMIVDFLRSPSELGDKLAGDESLFIMSEGVYLDDRLLAEMVAQQSPFLVTLDGRAENAAFERIDLNSFWAGLALLGPASIEAIAALPAEWSIGSSLLRRALQDSVMHRPIKQKLVDAGQLQKILNANDADMLSNSLLRGRAQQTDGWIERHIAALIVTQIAKNIWRYPSGRTIFEGLAGLSIVGAVISSYYGLIVPAALCALLVIIGIDVRKLLQDIDFKNISNFYINGVYWLLLSLTLFGVMRNNGGDFPYNLFPAMVMIGLFLMSKQSSVTGWRRQITCSAALVSVLVMGFGFFGLLTEGAMLLVSGQLLLMILGEGFLSKWQRG